MTVDPGLQTSAPTTILHLVPGIGHGSAPFEVRDPVATGAFDDLVQARADVQALSKTDPTWTKTR